MKKGLLFAAILVFAVVQTAYAQLDWAITDLKCGNGILDRFELCDKGVDENYCDDLGELLKIDTVCDTAHCTCLPRVNKAYCGNNIREGVELCDGSAEDNCPKLGNITNLSLKCNPKTCGCSINETIPAEYNPAVIEGFVNKSKISADCGNKKVERDEDCDPPNTLCSTSRKEPGVCSEKCKCIEPGEIETGKETPLEENNTSSNKTVEENITSENITAENTTIVQEPEKPGFFSKLWKWIAELFS